METLSAQLTELYNEHWESFMEQLEANGLRDKLQCPFLISLLRSGQKKEEREKDPNWYSKKETPEHEEWYTKADIKIMFLVKKHMDGKKIWIWATSWEVMKTSLTINM